MVRLIPVLLLLQLHYSLGLYVKWADNDTIWYVERSGNTITPVTHIAVYSLECSDDGKHLYVGFGKHVYQVDVDTGDTRTILTASEDIWMVRTDRFTGDLYYCTNVGEVGVIPLDKKQPPSALFLAQVADMDTPPNKNTNRLYFIYVGDYHLYFFDKKARRLEVWFKEFQCYSFTFSGQRLFIFTGSSSIISYNHDLSDKVTVLSNPMNLPDARDPKQFYYFYLTKGGIWYEEKNKGVFHYNTVTGDVETIVDCNVFSCDDEVYGFCVDPTDMDPPRKASESKSIQSVSKPSPTRHIATSTVVTTYSTTHSNPSLNQQVERFSILMDMRVLLIGISVAAATVLLSPCICLLRGRYIRQLHDRTASHSNFNGRPETNPSDEQPTRIVDDLQQVEEKEENLNINLQQGCDKEASHYNPNQEVEDKEENIYNYTEDKEVGLYNPIQQVEDKEERLYCYIQPVKDKGEGSYTYSEQVEDKGEGSYTYIEQVEDKGEGSYPYIELVEDNEEGLCNYIEQLQDKEEGLQNYIQQVQDKEERLHHRTEQVQDKEEGLYNYIEQVQDKEERLHHRIEQVQDKPVQQLH